MDLAPSRAKKWQTIFQYTFFTSLLPHNQNHNNLNIRRVRYVSQPDNAYGQTGEFSFELRDVDKLDRV